MTSPIRRRPSFRTPIDYNVVAFHAGESGAEHAVLLRAGNQRAAGPQEARRVQNLSAAPGPASFEIAFASCGRTGSTRDVFDRIREHRPLFYMSMGDFHYQDIRTNRPVAVSARPTTQCWRRRNRPTSIALCRSFTCGTTTITAATMPIAKSTTHPAARGTYELNTCRTTRSLNPETEEPINHTFTVGRVKFIITDLRSERDDPKEKDDENKTLMGEKQKKWFKDELLAANGKYPLICWMTSVPWIGEREVPIVSFAPMSGASITRTVDKTEHRSGRR